MQASRKLSMVCKYNNYLQTIHVSSHYNCISMVAVAIIETVHLLIQVGGFLTDVYIIQFRLSYS